MKLVKVAEGTLRKLTKKDDPELKSPINAIDIENLLSSIFPIKKSSSPLKSSNVKTFESRSRRNKRFEVQKDQ